MERIWINMGLFDKLFNPKPERMLQPLTGISDEDIVAPSGGELVDVKTVSDAVFAEEMMGKSIAFRYDRDKVILCAPANGKLSVLFPTGHAYGVERNDGVQILVHIGVDTVNSKGDGFRILDKKQGDSVKAGDPIVEVDIKKLSEKYDMSVILILADPKDKEFTFIDPQTVGRGQSLLKND